ncbi:MAG TPA: PilZ domain-containing protein [Sphingomicrobium sp.]|nr:PilZ domain-containing protein [Sphingomicrobium sp.]
MLEKASSYGLKPREERRRTMLRARMRSSAGWSDACILNVSSRGLLVYSDGAADPGSLVEVRRGGQLVVAKVVWRKNQRIGLRSTDELHVESLVSDEIAAAAAKGCAGSVRIEMRRRPREPDRSRESGRAMEFVSLVAVGMALAGLVAASVMQALAGSMNAITSALG